MITKRDEGNGSEDSENRYHHNKFYKSETKNPSTTLRASREGKTVFLKWVHGRGNNVVLTMVIV